MNVDLTYSTGEIHWLTYTNQILPLESYLYAECIGVTFLA